MEVQHLLKGLRLTVRDRKIEAGAICCVKGLRRESGYM